jgi:prevent-host-death family protein
MYNSYMQTITASQARSTIFRLMEKVSESHRPITITGKHTNAVLVSEEDWRAIEETLYLMSVPGMAQSLLKGKKTPLKNCDPRLKW